ncbi:DUF2956 domain-containing protein [Methylomonas sp. MgM2]
MSKNSQQKPSPHTQEEALKIAKSIQRPAQTKEQTKLIAQGIQQGIDLYKRQQKEKARELDKQRKKLAQQKTQPGGQDNNETKEIIVYRQHWLPWALLVMTWLGVVIYIATSQPV